MEDVLSACLLIEQSEDATVDETLDAWALLIRLGIVWQLQGFYGRTASRLIEAGIINPEGLRLA